MNVLFIDRDGTLINEPPGGKIDALDKLQLEPHVTHALKKLQKAEYRLVIISNQPGLGTLDFPQDTFDESQHKMIEIFANDSIVFDELFFCPHFLEDNCRCMKPKTGLIDAYLKKNAINLKKSYVIGDRVTDILLAKNIGCRSIHYSKKPDASADYGVRDWNKIAEYILLIK